jgi:transposase InsO family protein
MLGQRPRRELLRLLQGRAHRHPALAHPGHGRRATVEYIAWYNGTRIHSALGYQSPAGYEEKHHRIRR